MSHGFSRWLNNATCYANLICAGVNVAILTMTNASEGSRLGSACSAAVSVCVAMLSAMWASNAEESWRRADVLRERMRLQVVVWESRILERQQFYERLRKAGIKTDAHSLLMMNEIRRIEGMQ